MAKVLFVAANPQQTGRLGLDEEIHAIEERLRGSRYQKEVDFRSVWAARPDDLLQYLIDICPDALHFSGHGSKQGELVFVDDRGKPKPVSEQALKHTLGSAGDGVRLVFLNTCHSHNQARAAATVVPCAIGMNSSIGDEAAAVFSSRFYRALCNGFSVRKSFDNGISGLLLEGIPEDQTPELFHGAGINPNDVYLIDQPPNIHESNDLKLVNMALLPGSRYVMTSDGEVIRIALRAN